MRLPRFRVRTLMIAVAVVALSFFIGTTIWRMRQRANDYRAKAVVARWRETTARDGETFWAAGAVEQETVAVKLGDGRKAAGRYELSRKYRDSARVNKRHADYWAAIKGKYERAARYPWLPVEPDPPMPR